MTSQINPNGIDETFPVAGRDNSTQPFRDNFQSIKTNFTIAQSEITSLQNNAMLLSNLSGNTSALTNNLAGNPITNASLIGTREFVYNHGDIIGQFTIDFTKGSYHLVNLVGSATITAFQNFPDYPTAPGQGIAYQSRIRVEFIVPEPGFTVTLPNSVTLNYENIAGISTRTINFSSAGSYIFEFSTTDAGTNISVQDLNRTKSSVDTSFTVLANVGGTAVAGVYLTSQVIGGQIVGNVIANNVIAQNLINIGTTSLSLTGNVTAGNLIANANIYGTIQTPIQSNITLLGTLSSLSVSGNANVGNITVTGYTDMCGGTGYGVQYVTAVNSGTSSLYSNVGFAVINPSGTISGHTVVMPGTYGSAQNGQTITIAFANTVTSLTQSGAGSDTVYGAITTANSSQSTSWIYYKNAAINSGNGVWYRIM
jgi:hypothetical protein